MKPVARSGLSNTKRIFPTQVNRSKPLQLPLSLAVGRRFETSALKLYQNQVLDSVRTPPNFHDYLRLISSNNTLLLALFTTSACTPCRVITPLLIDLVKSRHQLPQDKYSALSFTEIELDSPDTSNGNMTDLAVEWAVRSMPTLIGFGGRRSDRVTDRLSDTTLMSDRTRMREWIDEQMQKGDPSGHTNPTSNGLLSRLFG